MLTYLGEGLGASILRVGIRLWAPGAVNPVAAIKIVRHNLYRPTSLFHETGHQVAHLAGWNDALGRALGETLADDPALRAMWQPWSSEIAADVYAFALTGLRLGGRAVTTSSATSGRSSGGRSATRTRSAGSGRCSGARCVGTRTARARGTGSSVQS